MLALECLKSLECLEFGIKRKDAVPLLPSAYFYVCKRSHKYGDFQKASRNLFVAIYTYTYYMPIKSPYKIKQKY